MQRATWWRKLILGQFLLGDQKNWFVWRAKFGRQQRLTVTHGVRGAMVKFLYYIFLWSWRPGDRRLNKCLKSQGITSVYVWVRLHWVKRVNRSLTIQCDKGSLMWTCKISYGRLRATECPSEAQPTYIVLSKTWCLSLFTGANKPETIKLATEHTKCSWVQQQSIKGHLFLTLKGCLIK
jgi:hypothetical protein